MVSGTDLFLSLFNNLAIFIVLIAVYGTLINIYGISPTPMRQIVMGLCFGCFAIICMHAKIPVIEGVIVDQRNTFIALSGVFGGPLAGIISAFMAGTYRIHLGGAGVVGGVIGVFLAALAGGFVHALRDKIDTYLKAFYGALSVTIIILPGFLFFEDLQTGWTLLKAMALPYGSAVFIGIFFAGLLMARQENSYLAKAALIKSEASLRITQFIFEKASIGIYHIGPDAQIYNANQKAAQDLGYSVEELCAMSIFDIDPVLTEKEWHIIWTSKLKSGWNKFERVHRRKDGSEMPVEITTNLLQYEGKVFSVAFAQDITDRKQWENRLKYSESRYQDLFDKAPVGYVVTDISENEPYIKDANEAFLKLLGYARNDVVDAPVSRFYTEASKQKLKKRDYQRALNGGALRDERDLLTRDGRIVNTILHVHPQLDADDNVIGMRVMYLDITDRKTAEEEAKRLALALMQAQKMETIGTLAGGIAHDFNNILGAIIGFAQLAQRNSKKNPKIQKYVEQVLVACGRAKELIQQILAFSRQSNMEKQPVDIGVVIKETLKLVRASIPTSIDIQQNIRTNIGTVEANQTQIHQVVLNLCTNAAHAMAKNGGSLVVELLPTTINQRDCSHFSDIEPGQYIKLTIKDTGTGMDTKTLSRIFEPYFTTKGVGEGTGMGLALVLGIVKDHGGDITVHSKPGVGTTFHVLLPAIESISKESLTTLDRLPAGSGCVLFVDDEIPLVDIGKEMLEILGYTVETRTSPNDALKAFQANPDKYDLVITDMSMPKMSGDRLAEAIKQIRPGTPVIICTGFSRMISQVKAKKMGVASVLMKPLTLEDLAMTVNDVLGTANK